MEKNLMKRKISIALFIVFVITSLSFAGILSAFDEKAALNSGSIVVDIGTNNLTMNIGEIKKFEIKKTPIGYDTKKATIEVGTQSVVDATLNLQANYYKIEEDTYYEYYDFNNDTNGYFLTINAVKEGTTDIFFNVDGRKLFLTKVTVNAPAIVVTPKINSMKAPKKSYTVKKGKKKSFKINISPKTYGLKGAKIISSKPKVAKASVNTKTKKVTVSAKKKGSSKIYLKINGKKYLLTKIVVKK